LIDFCSRTPGILPSSKLVQVGGFNPSEKYARQIGSFPQVGVKIQYIFYHRLVVALALAPSECNPFLAQGEQVTS